MNLNNQILGVTDQEGVTEKALENEPTPNPIEQDPIGQPSTMTEEADARSPENNPQETEAIPTASAKVADDATKYVTLLFNDGLNMPIQGLEVFVTLPTGEVCTATSTTQGAITVAMPNKSKGEARVEVKDHTEHRQQVCVLDVAKCHDAVTIKSPKVVTKHTLRPHQQRLPPNPSNSSQTATPNHDKHHLEHPSQTIPAQVDLHAPWWVSNGAWTHAKQWLKETLHIHEDHHPSHQPIVAETLNKAGNPIAVVVGGECPNKDNLSLGRNNIYRAALMEGAKRLGLIPQALCALINCEAGKVKELVPKLGPDGKPLKDKHGKLMQTQINKLWDPNSGGADSSAAGLTQFIDNTWLSCCLMPKYYIHQKCVENGWVKQEADKKGKKHWVFVLADGETTTNKPFNHKGDIIIKKCLNMRFDPTWSILAAADLGRENLEVIASKFNLSKLSDMDKAKLMYLYHHEGTTGGTDFINNNLAKTVKQKEALRHQLASQLADKKHKELGLKRADERIAIAGDDVPLAYRRWLAKFIDDKFSQTNEYYCSKPSAPVELNKIIKLIDGKEIDNPHNF